MKVFSILRYVSLGAILGYMVAEAVIHGFIDRYAEVPAFHALCPFEAFGTFLNSLTGLEFFSNPLASASIFFLFLIIIAILLNRVFCGFLCAFGALQEFVGNLGAKVLKKRPVIPQKADKIVRVFKYVFLVFSVLLAYFTGYEFFRNFLGLSQGSDAFSYIDPWIAFKSLLSNNLIVGGYIVSLVVLVGSLAASFFFQRFYCKYVCPLGALYAVFGSLSGVHIFRNVKPDTDDYELEDGCETPVDGDQIPIDGEEAEELESIEETEAINADEALEEDAAVDDEAVGCECDGDIEYSEDGSFDDDTYEDDDAAELDECDERGNCYCINCGKCSAACPMGIDVASVNGKIDFAECIACQRCVAACPKKGALQTRYFSAKIHPIVIMLITFLLFFGGVFAMNFIKIDRGGPAAEPIYDSIRLAPASPDDGSFSVSKLMDSTGMTFEELKEEYHLDDAVTMDSGYSEFSNGITLAYFKENNVDEYDDIIKFFGLSADTPLDTPMGDIIGDAPIRVAAEYLGFDVERIDDFAEYFGASADDKFSVISARFYEIYDEYQKFLNVNAEEWSNYIAQYGTWYQCSYGAEMPPLKNFYETAAECEYETNLAPMLASDKFTVQWMLQNDGVSLAEFKETYHLDDSVTLRSSYSDFFNAIKLSYYKAAYAANAEENGVDEFAEMIAVYGYTVDNVDLDMTVGKLLDSGTIGQAARFFGYNDQTDIDNFVAEYEGSSADAPFTEIHDKYDKSMDDYYNMIYQYYNSMYY